MTYIFIQYPHIIAMVVWFIITVLSLLRYFNYQIFARISWKALLIVAVVLHIGYASLLTWGQYTQWGSDSITKVFLNQPLPQTVPLTPVLAWARPALEQPLGYFIFYVFGHFWISTILLFGIAGFFGMLLKLRSYYRPWNFKEGEIVVITLALLVSGWPGVIVLLPLAFVFAIIFSVVSSTFYGVSRIYLAPAFLVAAPVALFLGITILKFTELYTLFKLS